MTLSTGTVKSKSTVVDSTRKWIFWFETKVTDEQEKHIRERLDKLGIKYEIVTNVSLPQIREFNS